LGADNHITPPAKGTLREKMMIKKEKIVIRVFSHWETLRAFQEIDPLVPLAAVPIGS
jgi:hypothetical protein